MPPMTAAKLEAISDEFRCAVSQELITAPAVRLHCSFCAPLGLARCSPRALSQVTCVCCKQNVTSANLTKCVAKMDSKKACPLCRKPLADVRYDLNVAARGAALFRSPVVVL